MHLDTQQAGIPSRGRRISRVLTFLMLVYPLLFVWQGLDVTDTGFALSNAQQMFRHAECVTYAFAGYWLSNLLAAVWLELFGFLGVLGFKIAHVLLIYATTYGAYRMVRDQGSPTQSLLAIFLSVTYITSSGANWLSYNTFTALSLVISALALFSGLRARKYWSILLAGMVSGASPFFRLPNLLSVLLGLSIVFYGLLRRQGLREISRSLALFLIGCVVGVLLILALLSAMGQHELYISSLGDLLASSGNPEYHHGVAALARVLVKDHLSAVLLAQCTFMGAFTATFVLSRVQRRWLSNAVIALFSVIAVVVLQPYIHLVVVGLLYCLLLARVGNLSRGTPESRLLAFIALLVLVLAPLGSNNGLRNARYGMWIAMPLALLFVLRMTSTKIACSVGRHSLTLSINGAHIDLGRKAVLATLIALSFWAASTYTYRDTAHRLTMRYAVDHPLLRGIYTTQERARVMQGLLDELRKYVHPGDHLLAFEQTSLVYYLTETQPYLYNSWPMLYEPQMLEASLERAFRERKSLPVFVRATGSTSESEWPMVKREPVNDSRHRQNREIVDRYLLTAYDYRLAWKNEFFEIWLPGQYRSAPVGPAGSIRTNATLPHSRR